MIIETDQEMDRAAQVLPVVETRGPSAEDLLPLVHDGLQRLAAARLANEAPPLNRLLIRFALFSRFQQWTVAQQAPDASGGSG